MKRSILSIAVITMAFIGLGAVVEKTSARFGSDDKALELVRKARVAIGGDAAISAVRSMRIVGTVSHTMNINGVDTVKTGECEIALMLPDTMMKSMKMGDGSAVGEQGQMKKSVDVTIVNYKTGDDDAVATSDDPKPVRKIVLKTADGGTQILSGDDANKAIADGRVKVRTGDGNVVFDRGPHPGGGSEMAQLMLGLLLSPPDGMKADYTFGGEGDLGGTPAFIVNASVGGSVYKLYLDRSTSLPVGITFDADSMPQITTFARSTDDTQNPDEKKVVILTRAGHPNGDGGQVSVKFSDFRNVDGLLLPFKWTHTGAMAGEMNITTFEINPAGIEDRFKEPNVKIRHVQPDGH